MLNSSIKLVEYNNTIWRNHNPKCFDIECCNNGYPDDTVFLHPDKCTEV